MKPIPPVLLEGSALPARLSDLANAPKLLHVRGELPRGPAVAIVGTRSPTPEAAAFAGRLAADLARAGVAILSGGARGIDSEAHRAALQVRGVTVVVAPSGYARPYPPENEALFARIVRRGGAYVALVEDDVPATRGAFFARNACLAALAWAVVVVQAGLRSGARNAAKEARQLGRALFAVPSAPWIPQGRGCLEELRLGARLCQGASDVLAALEALGAQPIPLPARSGSRRARQRAAQAELPWPHHNEAPGVHPLEASAVNEPALIQRVTDLIGRGATEAGEVADLAGLSVASVNRILLTLRLQGVLVSAAPGHLALRKSAD